MAEGTSSGEENANLYMRGVNEGRAGELLDGEELLAILDVFGEDGLKAYIVGHLEGVADAMEDLEEGDAAEDEAAEEYEEDGEGPEPD
jgi:hypothetical protein